MRIKKRLLGSKRLLSLPLSILSRYWKNTRQKFFHLFKQHSRLETDHRRYEVRRNIERFTQRIWDAAKKLPTVARSLPQHPLREKEDERIQQKKRKTHQRALRFAKLIKSDVWTKDLVKMLNQWEKFCYMNLRFPETRKDKVSLDSFIGFQNGALWVIEGLRKSVYGSVISDKKKNAISN